MLPNKIYAAVEWIMVAITSPFAGDDDGVNKRGDLIGIEVGTGDKSAHQVSLTLEGARELRDQLSEVIYDLESLEDDVPSQTELPF